MKLAMGVPVTSSGVFGEVYGSHLALAGEMAKVGELTIISPFTAPSVDGGRNFIWNYARECDYLMCVDHDVLLPINTFSTLFEALKRRSAQVVAGRYYLRGHPFANIWGLRSEKGYAFTESNHECELDGCGLGCTLIDIRWVEANLKSPLFVTTRDEHGQTIGTEDYFFCRKVKDAGGIIIGVPSVDCGHVESKRTVVTSRNGDLLRRMELVGDLE